MPVRARPFYQTSLDILYTFGARQVPRWASIGAIPDSVLCRSDMGWDHAFGTTGYPGHSRNAHIRIALILEAGVQRWPPYCIRGSVGAFYITKCKRRRGRGKGLARHFLQIVPTCL